MKKIIASLVILSLAVMILGPVLTVASITTELTRSTGTGEGPIVKAKWEMNGPYQALLGTDDSTAPGAQFAPPGIWDETKQISFCAIVTDPNGVSDIDGVYADWYFPVDTAFHPEALSPYEDQIGGGFLYYPDGSPGMPDYGQSGCGAPYEDENELFQLEKMQGYELFCERIRSMNNNLPTFYPPYDYDEICGETGELMKEEAYVYCADKQLIWEDPAGLYKVEILALDKAGLFNFECDTACNGNPNFNYFEYLPMTGYEADFTHINYGEVKLNTHKRVSGDKTFDLGDAKPSVRNTGNTRLYMWVEQDDMGLGTTDGNWNVQYDARVGNNEADWRVYDPEMNQKLEDILDLSEVEEMDFSIEVFKFPTPDYVYTGEVWLSATQADFRQCLPD